MAVSVKARNGTVLAEAFGSIRAGFSPIMI
jgi:hypothetical protein